MEIQMNNLQPFLENDDMQEISMFNQPGDDDQDEISEEEPVLDEEDMEENDLSEEEAEEIEWDKPQGQDQDLSTSSEKDITA
jgi:hypothetical protein